MQVLAAINTYKGSADLTLDPPKTTYDNDTLTGLYGKERLGWALHIQKPGELLWILVPPTMKDYVGCMEASIDKIGEPDQHVYNRDAPEALAPRATYGTAARAPTALLGMGSPVSMKWRRCR